MGSIHVTHLETLIRSPGSAVSPEMKIALSNLQGEIKYRLANGSAAADFFAEIAQSLTHIRGSANADVRMQCLFDCATFFYLNRHCTHAVQTLQHIHHLASQTSSKASLRRAKTFQGLVFADLGNIADAVPLHCQAFELARELGDIQGQIVSLTNLGVALNYAGLYREAIPCFRQAAALALEPNVVPDLHNAALTNLAQSHLYLEEYEIGFEMIAQALARSPEPQDAVAASARAVREYTFVQLALELGKFDLAKQHATACAHYGRGSGMSRSKAVAEIALALCQIHSGDVQVGIRALENTLAANGETALKEAALVALVKAYDCAEQPERALSCLDALITHLRTNREKNVAAFLMASSSISATPDISSEHMDLRGLTLREARLRARVAERKTVSTQLEMLERFAVTAALRDDASGEHGYRVGKLAGLLAHALKWDAAAIHALELGARLHDIGKIGVPDRILLTSKELREVERQFICAHTALGGELLGKSSFPQVKMAEEIARHHHEWWNGEGYPARLSMSRIPLHARIVAIVDVFDALTHGRPYADPWHIDRALNEISGRRGTQFDPELTEVFLHMIDKLRDEQADLDHFLSSAANNSPFAQARIKIRRMLSTEETREHEDSSP